MSQFADMPIEQGQDNCFLHEKAVCLPVQFYPLFLIERALTCLNQGIELWIPPAALIEQEVRLKKGCRVGKIRQPSQEEEIEISLVVKLRDLRIAHLFLDGNPQILSPHILKMGEY